MIDIHSHILPGVDDGAKDMDMSLKMLKMAEDKGTKIIVATPHYIKNVYENQYQMVYEVYSKLKLAATAANINIEILLGQEIMLDTFSLKLCKEQSLQGINGTKYMLVEFPMDKLPQNAMDLIYELRIMDKYPIIAHPERYVYLQENLSTINKFIEEGCIFQINTGSLEGIFGKKVEKCAKSLVNHGMANFIASDTHSIEKRCPGLLKGYKEAELIDKNIVKKLTNNCELMLSNKIIELNIEKVKERKRIFDFFK